MTQSYPIGAAMLTVVILLGCGSEQSTSNATRADTSGTTSGTSATTNTGSTSTTNAATATSGGVGTSGGIGLDAGTNPDDLTKTSKVDLLFAIDNSLSMGDKQRILAQTVPDLIGRMATPDCINNADQSRVPSQVGGICPDGSTLEFVPVTDIHIAVISSSLGAFGGSEICTQGGTNYNPTQEDMARLLSRGANGQVPTYQNLGFLAWDPDNDYGGETDLPTLTSNFADMVTGVGEQGCGYEAQLESVYRFLMDPKPYATLEPDSASTDPPYVAVPTGVDQTILEQRKAFLRPDSMLAIFTITDENDCSVRVTQTGASGVAGTQFHVAVESEPLWKASAACSVDPNDPCCISCGETPPDGCNVDCSDPVYSRTQDNVNLRCFNQKKRFGIDMLYPIERYIQGIESTRLPNPDDPSDADGVVNPIYDDLTCTPGSPECKGPRDRRLIFWVGIVGVPWQDVAVDPNDFNQGLLAASEFEAQGRWNLILGDPASGLPPGDPFMVESIAPRTGAHPLTGATVEPPEAVGAANPINGHEYNTASSDLQYACIFELPEPRDCSSESSGACDCVDNPFATLDEAQNPLCQQAGSTAVDNMQRYAKAYPSTRILEVLRGLSQGAVVSSICPANLSDPASPNYGYRPVIPPLMDQVKEIIIPK